MDILKGKVAEKPQWYDSLTRGDCRVCKHRTACGDIFPSEGCCPANSGGETWAKFEEVKSE